MPHPDPRVEQVADNVWLYLPHWQRLEPTVGMVLSSEGWVLIDSGNSPAHSRRIREALQRIKDAPVRYVVNTHRHFDHVFGNQTFAAPVIASLQCRKRFQANLQDDWAPHRVQSWLEHQMLPHIASLSLDDFRGLQLVPPTLSFSRRMELDLGRASMTFFPLSGAHCDDHIGVHLPQQRLLFVGDAWYLREAEGQFTHWLKLLDTIVEWEAETIVPGHEPPYERLEVEMLRAYGHELIESVISAIRSGLSEQEALKMPFPPRYRNVPFLNRRTHERLLKAAYRELEASSTGGS